MRIVLQRVRQAMVDISDKTIGEISEGYLLLLGIKTGDTRKDADWLVEKILKLRLFKGDEGKSFMEKNIVEVDGGILVVSQFTLYGNCRKGTRPNFTDAASPEIAKDLYEYAVQKFMESGLRVETGEFGEHMDVQLINDGPITLVIDSSQS